METLILALIVFVLCFIVRLMIYVIGKKRKKKRGGIATDMLYLINKFKLDKKKIDRVGIAAIISILDALIISGTLSLVTIITDNITLELILGLVFVIVLIFIVYEIFGKILVKKGYGLK